MSGYGFQFAKLSMGLALATLVGCSSSSDGGGNGNAVFNVESLSGNVRSSGGAGLPGVTVTVCGSAATTTTTDSAGDFIIPSLGMIPSGQVDIELDGSTATVAGTFPVLDVVIDLPAGQTAVTLPQVITLPDLGGADSGNQMVTVDAGTGATAAPIAVTAGAASDIMLDAPAGTIITIDGMVGSTMVDVNVTPVPPMEVPMPLPEGLLGGSFVTIQPADADFDNAGLGIDLTLPNTQGLPVGTMVDIYAFDHEDSQWVNRSTETGQQGMVVDNAGTLEVQAPGVVTEGGWHTPAITVDPSCATTFVGRVIDDVSGAGIAGATIALGTGQFGFTDTDGNFSIPLVPSYDTAALAADPLNCIAENIDYEISLPASFGMVADVVATLGSASVVTGGTTTLPDVSFTVGSTGTLVGLLTGPLDPGEMVMLTDSAAMTTMVMPQANGSFTQTGLMPDDYTVSYLFMNAQAATTAMVTVVANDIATVNLQDVRGQGGATINVLVLEDDENPLIIPGPVANSMVLLFGTDAGSMNGLLAATDVNGIATFNNVTGPFTVTASSDQMIAGQTVRVATSLVGIDPPGSTIGLFLSPEPIAAPVVADATLNGTVSNLPALMGSETFQVFAEETDFGGELGGFIGSALVDPITGAYSLPIPSGVDFDISFAHMDPAATSQTLTTILAPSVTGTTTGGTVTQDFDFTGAGAVAWDQPVDLTFMNELNGVDVEIGMDLVDLTNGNLFIFDLYSGPVMPVTLNLPDFTNANYAGFSFSVFVEQEDFGTEEERECLFLPTVNPTTLAVNFGTPPSFTSLMDGDSLTVAQFESLNVTFTEGTSAFANGPNILFFTSDFGGTPPAGIDSALWQVFVPAGTTNVTLPTTPLPLFATGQPLFAEIEQPRFSAAFDFNAFFNDMAGQNLITLLTTSDQCDSGEDIDITLQ